MSQQDGGLSKQHGGLRNKMVSCVILFLPLLASSLAQPTSPSPLSRQYAALVSDLQRHYHTHCVFLATSDDPSAFHSTVVAAAGRTLTRRQVATTFVTFAALRRAGMETLACQKNRPLIAVFAEDSRTRQFLREMTKLSSYPQWVIFVEANISYSDFLQGVNIPFDCEVVFAQKQEGSFSLDEIYRVQKDLPVVIETFGEWSSEQGLVAPTTSLYVRRNSLRGFVVRVATLNSPPIIILNNTAPRDRDPLKVGGYFGEVWTVLQERMKFKSAYFFPPDNGYGSQLANGSWNGMFAMVLDGRVDVAINEFSMTVGRESVVHTMMPLIFTTSSIFIRQPNTLSLRWDNFLAPFAANLWFAVIASIAVIGTVLSVVYNVGRKFGNADENGPARYTLPTALFAVYGDDITPSAVTSRWIHFLAGIMSIIVLAAYSGGLVSYLTAGVTTLPFNNFQEMLRDGSYTLTVLAKSGKLNLFETTSDTLLHQLYTKLLLPHKDKLPNSVKEGLVQVCLRHKNSFMTAYDIALGMMNDLPCRLVGLQRASLPDAAGMVLPKDSPYRGLFNYNLQFLRTTGVINRLRVNAWSTKMPEVLASFSSVSLEAVTPIFTIIASGVLLCCLLLLAELCTLSCRHRWRRWRRRLDLERALQIRSRHRDKRLWAHSVYK